VTLLRQEGWTRWPTEVPSNPDHSVILWSNNSENKIEKNIWHVTGWQGKKSSWTTVVLQLLKWASLSSLWILVLSAPGQHIRTTQFPKPGPKVPYILLHPHRDPNTIFSYITRYLPCFLIQKFRYTWRHQKGPLCRVVTAGADTGNAGSCCHPSWRDSHSKLTIGYLR